MTSLRGQLVVSLVAGVVLAFALTAVVLHRVARGVLVDQFDTGLAMQARALGSLLEASEAEIEDFEFSPEAMPEYLPGPEAAYFEVRDAAGRTLARSPSLGTGELFPVRAGGRGAGGAGAGAGEVAGAARFDDVTLPDGRPGRRAVVRLLVRADDDDEAPGARPEAEVAAARSRAPLEAGFAELLRGVLLASLAAALLTGALVHAVVRRALSPVRRMAETLHGIDASTLDRRVETRGAPAELLPFCERINALLGRLESAFGRERRMTSAIAHELRTPLSELRAAVDVSARWPDDPDLRRQALATAGEVARRMGDLVETILRVARAESGQAGVRAELVLLRELVAETWRSCEARASARGVALRNDVPPGTSLRSDRDLLALVIGNLLDNGARFAAPSSEVRVALAPGAVEVSNPAPELTPSDLPRLTEPFWRGDPARSDGHSGLGLPLVGSVLAALGGRLVLELHEGRLVARVELPAALRPPVAAPMGAVIQP